MSEAFTFTVNGTPRPLPRGRHIAGRAKPISIVSPKVRLWRLAVERACRQAIADSGRATPLFTGAIEVSMIFTFRPPAGAMDRLGQPHAQKPDASNLLKLPEDVMETCGVYRNDCIISKPVPEKLWGMKPGVVITIRPARAAQRASTLPRSGAPPAWLKRS